MSELRKRVVLFRPGHPPQIAGMFDGSVHTLRPEVEFNDASGQKLKATLVKQTPHAIYYQEKPGIVTRLIDKLTS